MTGRGRRVARTAVLVAAGAQTAGVVTLVTLGAVSDGPLVDWMRPLPLAAIYLLPAVLAVMSLSTTQPPGDLRSPARRGRSALLLAGATTALVLAVFPFSLHSFVLGPVGLVYLASYLELSRGRRGGARALTAVLACPLLVLAALLVLLVHEDPACYTQRDSGDLTVNRNPGDVTSGQVQLVIPAGSDVVRQGCTGNTVVWWEAAGSLALTASALMAGLCLVPRKFSNSRVEAAESGGRSPGRESRA